MSAWLDPPPDLSAAARDHRARWAEHWPDADPQAGGWFPDRGVRRTTALHKAFRSPLSSASEVDATADFISALLGRLTVGTLVVDTFDWEWSVAGRIGHERFTAVAGLDRDRWLRMSGEPADTAPDPPVITHVYRTALRRGDRRVAEIALAAARGVPITVTDEGVTWVARLDEDVVDLHCLEASLLDAADEVRVEVTRRWGLDRPRHPLIDLGEIEAHVRDQRAGWKRRGVRVTTEPQYRSWPDDTIVVLSTPPADWAEVDWLLIGLTAGEASATVIAHDAGTCTVLLDRDQSGETAVRHRERAGTLDVGGVIATLEAVVTALAARASSTGPDT